MDRLRKAALTTRLIQKLRDEESWCGETHVQKATYVAQRVAGVPMEYEFILYKHGPFCFDLRDDLTALRADGIVALEIQRPYGPRIALTPRSEYIQSKYPRTLKKHEKGITFVAKALGGKGVVDLERLGTALYVGDELDENASAAEKAARMTKLKPHISRTDALKAVREADMLTAEAASLYTSA